MSAVAGLRGTGDWGTDERPKNFRELILWRMPNADVPLTALMGRTKSEVTTDPEFKWWDEPVDLVRLTVDFAGDYGTTETTITVDSTDPTANDPAANWGVAQHLKPGDLLLVEPAADNATFNHENLEVTGVVSDTEFTVKRGAAGTTAAAIADDSNLLLIGSLYAEGTPAPKATSRNPILYTNKCQIFKDSYELTETVRVTTARTGDPLKNDRRRKMHDHARGLEFAMLFGAQSEVVGDNGKPKRTMDGLRKAIPADTTTVFGAAVTVSSFLDAAYKVFDFTSPAGDQRIALCGNTFLNELNKVIQTDGQTQITFGPKITMFGMNLREYILPQGSLFLRTHPLLNRHALYTKSAFLVDFSALRWRHMPGRDTNFKDNVQNNDEDTRKGRWLTEGGLEVQFGGLTCGYLGNMSAT